MSSSLTRHPYSGHLVFLAAVVAALCGACIDSKSVITTTSAAVRAPGGYEGLDLSEEPADTNGDVGRLSLRLARRVALGDSLTAPTRVQDVAVSGDTIFVLDDFTKTVRVFDRRGRPLFTFGQDGRSMEGFADPFALALTREHLLVLNMRRTKPVQLWDRNGHYVGTHSFVRLSSPTSLASLGDKLAVSTFTPVVLDGKEFLATMSDSAGTILGRGCLRDPRYAASAARRGMLTLFAPSGLSTDGQRIFCTQPASAVVQIIDLQGNLIGVVRRTPPFYRAPRDAPSSMNPKSIYAFLSSWTGMRRFFSQPHGFVSLFTTADSTRDRYSLFACDSTAGSVKCSAGVSPGRLLAMLPGDTLMILEDPVKGSSIPKLGFYVDSR